MPSAPVEAPPAEKPHSEKEKALAVELLWLYLPENSITWHPVQLRPHMSLTLVLTLFLGTHWHEKGETLNKGMRTPGAASNQLQRTV